MKKIDIIILSNTADQNYHNLLGITVNSIKEQTDIESNIILVETNKDYKTKEQYNLPIDVLVVPDEPFHFNRFLNHGLQHSSADYICCSNNDVRYFPHSFYHLIEALQTYDSVSPYAEGYSNGLSDSEITECDHLNKCFFGFCYCFTRKTMNECFSGKFDETFAFWLQDNDIIYTLRDKGAKHALVGPAKAEHLDTKGSKGKGANSYKLFGKDVNKYTWGQQQLMRKKWKIR